MLQLHLPIHVRHQMVHMPYRQPPLLQLKLWTSLPTKKNRHTVRPSTQGDPRGRQAILYRDYLGATNTINLPPPQYVYDDPLYSDDEISEADVKLTSYYGDIVHQNDGYRLHGGIDDNKYWQRHWTDLPILPSQRYDLPMGVVRWRFLDILTTLMTGVVERGWNSKRLICFGHHTPT